MKFLLNAAARLSSRRPKQLSAKEGGMKLLTSKLSPNGDAVVKDTWGQQCSPQCGCVVRFQAKVDETNGRLIEAEYFAKSVVSMEKNGRLAPVYTTTTKRPMLSPCKCKTVHTLANSILSHIENQKTTNLRNWTEFTFTRASTAFRRAALANLQLPVQDKHCFDLVEEAFTALVKGYIPPARRRPDFEDMMKSSFKAEKAINDEDEMYTQPGATIESTSKLSLSMSLPGGMSTLNMLDLQEESYMNDEYDQPQDKTTQNGHPTMDWLTFVDEQYHKAESA